MVNGVVVLLGGFMCDERLFSHQAIALRDAGFDVQAGNLTSASSIETIARQVLAAAPSRFALAGLSLGGIIAFEIVRQEPERVTHLALLGTTPHADAASAARKRQLKRVARGEPRRVCRRPFSLREWTYDRQEAETSLLARGA